MTQEEKDLLLKDLCARLPYGVKVEITHWRNRDKGMMDSKISRFPLNINKASVLIKPTSDVRPYLFPLSSMSAKQRKEYAHLLAYTSNVDIIQITGESTYDWLNRNMFDWRGLIPKGLANDATGLNIY